MAKRNEKKISKEEQDRMDKRVKEWGCGPSKKKDEQAAEFD